MAALRPPFAAGIAAAILVLACATTASSRPAPASAPVRAQAAGYTVSVGAPVPFTHPTDTPASVYTDKDGTFHYQQSAALYGADDPRSWDFYTGTDFDSASFDRPLSTAVNPANPADSNGDTTWRCNNGPTGLAATSAPAGSGYAQRDYCDLSGVWVDPDTGDWYGLVHNEFTPQPFGDGIHYDAIDYAVSRDQGRTWTIRGHALTSPYSTKRNDTAAFPNQTYYYGDGDQRLFTDTASGYFYVYYGSRVVEKGGSWSAFQEHVARAPISAKMAPGSWQKWYDGAWSQPGTGGRESNMVPVDASGAGTGYTPVTADYDPANTGTAAQQIAAGKMPPTSPLFVMNIAYDAHLRLYVGEPQAVNQDGTEPQHLYATDDLSTQKWRPIGDTGSYTTASWYRWFLDGANRTSSTIVGRTFRSYCSFGCSGGSSGEYVNVTVDPATPAAPPVDTSRAYRITAAGGRVLAQASGGSAATSVAAPTGSALESWTFTPGGDGSYRIANTATGGLLGVDSAATAGRAWGARPTVGAAPAGGPGVGQQWFVVADTSAAGAPTGTYRLVNRYSGLVLALSADSGRLAETTPARSWTDTTGSAVGGSRTAAQQTLSLVATGSAPVVSGTHTAVASGKALDDPDRSTAPGTQLITWSPNGAKNQNWVFARQPDGSYQITSSRSALCMDVDGGSTAPGTAVIQWTCTGGSNQRWTLIPAGGGTYTVRSVSSGLLLTTASTADGAHVTQQPDTGSALQRWTIG
ncbi:RICIN domain-containing protein [Actinacidiphila bryophytorum]|uniref:RICIN domain-containing protein n=1 Tax=Actinacidiphila bryophytorum TaxID=1436133 RepID=A0A9W4E537_9ACTN|nr:RICIN domain-containing protein [Actinacidiphila bryophytorum]MBM9437931.1 RICIN domain-containing protein [Actinacidiphila bryophytorum]MBN6542824.1 RICIN domain-containing protein [Actinacidiphila bryophytorum]CAG7623470.1 RICIN domain-containing protein [Actinacidiphila bryophytorum]